MEILFVDNQLINPRTLDFLVGVGYDIKLGKARLMSSIEYRFLNWRLVSFNVGVGF